MPSRRRCLDVPYPASRASPDIDPAIAPPRPSRLLEPPGGFARPPACHGVRTGRSSGTAIRHAGSSPRSTSAGHSGVASRRRSSGRRARSPAPPGGNAIRGAVRRGHVVCLAHHPRGGTGDVIARAQFGQPAVGQAEPLGDVHHRLRPHLFVEFLTREGDACPGTSRHSRVPLDCSRTPAVSLEPLRPNAWRHLLAIARWTPVSGAGPKAARFAMGTDAIALRVADQPCATNPPRDATFRLQRPASAPTICA